jgi:DNA-binding response OmpR family regulator
MLHSVLESHGYAVREAQSGRVALGEIALDPPSLIILDLGLPDTLGTQNIFKMGSIEVNLERRQVLRDGRPIELTPREYALLRLLILHSDRVLTHSQILRELWGSQGENQNHYLRVYMMRLRRKLGEEAGDGYIQTQSGVGYCFVSSPVGSR